MIKSLHPFQLIHVDIWGPFNTPTSNGERYFLTVFDDFSRGTWVFLMHSKIDVIRLLKQFFALVVTQFSAQVKSIRTYNAADFFKADCRDFFSSHGVIHFSSCPYTPQQNGVVERKHRHILEIARALRFQSSLPLKFWGDCVLTAVYLINRTPSPILSNKNPFECLFHTVPYYTHLRTFCLCMSPPYALIINFLLVLLLACFWDTLTCKKVTGS